MPNQTSARNAFSMPGDIHAVLKARAEDESRSMVAVLRRLLAVPPAAVDALVLKP